MTLAVIRHLETKKIEALVLNTEWRNAWRHERTRAGLTIIPALEIGKVFCCELPEIMIYALLSAWAGPDVAHHPKSRDPSHETPTRWLEGRQANPVMANRYVNEA